MTTAEVSIVIVNWNSGGHLAACLQSLRDNPPSRAWAAVVVDNASTDASVDRAKGVLPEATFVQNAQNRGLAAANNQGMVAVASPVIVLANPDVTFEPGALDALCEVLDRRPQAAIAVPQLLQGDGSKQVSAMSLPTAAEALVPSLRRRAQANAFPHDRETRVGHGADACFAVRRRAVATVGGLDERFPLDWEAIDWSRRFARSGWEAWFTPAARVVHAGGVSVRQVPYRWIAQSHVGLYRYLVGDRAWLAPLVAPIATGRALIKAAATALGRARYDTAHERARLPER
jgi:N-acetylglucosaminyl-diphospho-decaprenol L-rhamnosyltransferase